jgi:hypothetical protein
MVTMAEADGTKDTISKKTAIAGRNILTLFKSYPPKLGYLHSSLQIQNTHLYYLSVLEQYLNVLRL